MTTSDQSVASEVVHRDAWVTVRVDRWQEGDTDRTYTVVERPAAVVVLPVSPDGQMLLVEQLRHPTGQRSWEFPMGGVDHDESPKAAARRELHEETGIDDVDLDEVGTFHPVPGLSPQTATVFVARVSLAELRSAVSAPATDDIVDRRVVDVDSFRDLLASGLVTDGFTLSSWALASGRVQGSSQH